MTEVLYSAKARMLSLHRAYQDKPFYQILLVVGILLSLAVLVFALVVLAGLWFIGATLSLQSDGDTDTSRFPVGDDEDYDDMNWSYHGDAAWHDYHDESQVGRASDDIDKEDFY